MDRFDEVFSVLTEDQGWSEENARKIMVYCAEQGMNPVEAAARFVGGMAGLPTVDMRKSFFNPWNMFPKKPQPQKGLPKTGPSSSLPTQKALPPARPIATPNQTQGMLGSRSVPTSRQLGQAPVPQFGPDKARPKIGPATPPTAYEKIRPPADAGIKARTALNTPKPTLPKPSPSLFGKLKNIATGIRSAAGPAIAQSIGLELSTKLAQSAGRPGQSKLSKLGALPGRSEYAPVYRTPLNTDAFEKPQQKISEPKKQEVTGDDLYRPRQPKTEPVQTVQKEKPVTKQKLSAAAKDFDKTFATARAAGEKEFTWRGKRYNTKLK
jgi:hypothetical protein